MLWRSGYALCMRTRYVINTARFLIELLSWSWLLSSQAGVFCRGWMNEAESIDVSANAEKHVQFPDSKAR